MSLFIQVGDAHVADSSCVCIDCFIKHTVVIVAERLPDTPKKQTPKANKRASIRQEDELAAVLGGKRQYGSGNSDWAKGDVRKRGEARGEAKTTRAQSRSISRNELEKIRAECSPGETPFMSIQFCNRNWQVEDEWIVLPIEEWSRLRALQDRRPGNRKR